MKLKTIHIENVKGIENATFVLDIVHNKVAILVAPNGFGKSSLAVAFEDINGKRIALKKNNLHKEDENLQSKVSLTYEIDGVSKSLTATNTSNNISNEFDVFVINNNLYAKTKQQSINGNTVATSSIAVAPIILIPTIPERIPLSYSYKEYKGNYNCGNILPNITSNLINNKLLEDLGEINYAGFQGKRYQQKISDVKRILCVTNNGTIEDKKSQIKKHPDFTALKDNSQFIGLSSIFKKHYPNADDFEVVYSCLQIIDVYINHPSNYKKACKYASYLNEKNEYDSLFRTLETTWKDIRPQEEDGKLKITFPKAILISNGQRDFLNFISSFISIKRNIKKPNCIIIIDEVFDYLDDSNLIVAQYFISNMIKELSNEKKIFPIILTHLDPMYFGCYRFKKPQIKYLYSKQAIDNKNIEKIISSREELKKNDEEFNSNLDRYYFHYSPDYSVKDYSTNFVQHHLHECYNTPTKFRTKILSVLDKYVKNGDFDVVSVCCALRIIIEELVYNKIVGKEQKNNFIETYKTDEKLRKAEEYGADFPETFFLLGVIYNEALHLSTIDKLIPISRKLENPFVHKMIEEVYSLWENYNNIQ